MVTEGTVSALRIVFFGTPAFAVPTLDALFASAHAVVGVVTQPDRPRGRGHHIAEAPIKGRASGAGVPVLQPLRLKDPSFTDALRALHADLGVVAAYGRILTDEVLAIPRLGMINVHASLLPKYRGAAPVHRAIIAGEHETGVTIMKVVRALDAGPMLRSAITSETAGTGDPGTIVEAGGDRLIVATGDAPLRLVQIQAEGKRPMLVRDFMAGHHLSAGDRFTAASGA